MAEKIAIIVEATDKASDVFKNIGGAGVVLGGVIAGVGLAISAAVVALIDFTKVAAEAEEVQTRFDTLVGNSNLADFTDEMYALADGLSTVTRFDDETILSAQGMLSTFGTIGKEIFPDVTKAALDLAEATGQDASSAASTLGRAFADMAGGSLGALRGVAKLTDAQKEAAEEMAKAGDIAGAQQLVIDILGEKFGGLAEKMGGTFSGQMTIFQNRIDNMKEALGAELLPLLTPLMEKFGDLAETVVPLLGQAIDQYVLPIIRTFSRELTIFSNLLSAGVSPVDALVAVFEDLTGIHLESVFSSIQPGLDAFGAFWEDQGPTILALAKVLFDELTRIMSEIATDIIPFVVNKFNELGAWFAENGPLISRYISVIVAVIGGIGVAIQAVWTFIQPLLGTMFSLLFNNAKLVMQLITGDFAGALETWKEGFSMALQGISQAFTNLASFVTGWFGTDWATVASQWQSFFDGLGRLWNEGLAGWGAFFDGISRLFSESWSNIQNTFSGAIGTWSSNWNTLKQIATSVWGMVKEAIRAKWSEISTFVSGAIQGLITQFKNAGARFSEIGNNIVSGIQAGITGAWASLESIVSSLVGDLIAAIKKMFGIASPSKVMAGVGENLMAGLAKGMSSGISIPVNAMMETVPTLTNTASKAAGNGASAARSNNQRVNIYGPVTLKLAGESEFLKVR